jgi:hypothetical protein
MRDAQVAERVKCFFFLGVRLGMGEKLADDDKSRYGWLGVQYAQWIGRMGEGCDALSERWGAQGENKWVQG